MTTDELSAQDTASLGGRPAVTVRNLRIETTNGTAVVPDASFEILPGEVLDDGDDRTAAAKLHCHSLPADELRFVGIRQRHARSAGR